MKTKHSKSYVLTPVSCHLLKLEDEKFSYICRDFRVT